MGASSLLQETREAGVSSRPHSGVRHREPALAHQRANARVAAAERAIAVRRVYGVAHVEDVIAQALGHGRVVRALGFRERFEGIGGVASVLGGGKFKNGAITAAFARLYNDEQKTRSTLSKRSEREQETTDLQKSDSSSILARVSAWNEERKFCVQQTYGDSYQAAWDLTPLDLPSILIDEITELTEGALSRIGNRNMYGNARQYEAGKRQLRTLSQF